MGGAEEGCAVHRVARSMACTQCRTMLCPLCPHVRVNGRPWCSACAAPLEPTAGRSLQGEILWWVKLLGSLGFAAIPVVGLESKFLGGVIGGALLFGLWPRLLFRDGAEETLRVERWVGGRPDAQAEPPPARFEPPRGARWVGLVALLLLGAGIHGYRTRAWWLPTGDRSTRPVQVAAARGLLPDEARIEPRRQTDAWALTKSPTTWRIAESRGVVAGDLYVVAGMGYRWPLATRPREDQRQAVEEVITELIGRRLRLRIKGFIHREDGYVEVEVDGGARAWPGGAWRVSARALLGEDTMALALVSIPERPELRTLESALLGALARVKDLEEDR